MRGKSSGEDEPRKAVDDCADKAFRAAILLLLSAEMCVVMSMLQLASEKKGKSFAGSASALTMLAKPQLF